MATAILIFEIKNIQEDYLYMAKGIEDGEYYIGYIVVDKPWYSHKDNWTYYIVDNKYGSGGICGGAVDLGFEKRIVDKATIEPYNQIAKIKYNQSIGMDTLLVKNILKDANDVDNKIAFIGVNDRIPVELWD